MNITPKLVLEKFALVSVTAALSSAIVLHQTAKQADLSVQQVLRGQSLEIVDQDGRTCVVLKAGENGGSLQLLSPSKGEGQEGTIAYLGSVFGDDLHFLLKEPKAEGKTSVAILLGGEPSYPSISGVGGSGTSTFRLGAIGNESPMLSLWHLSEEAPYFSK